MSVNVLVFDWLIRNYETYSLVNSWCLENRLTCDWKSLSRNVIMQVLLPAAVIFQVPVQWCQWFLARKSCILVNERQCFTTTPWWSKQYCMPPMYGPRAVLGICRGFFVSRSEVLRYPWRRHASKQWWTVHEIGLASPSPWGEVEHLCSGVHKRINGRSQGYMSDLLMLNSDINEWNNKNSSLNLVCPGELGAGAYIWSEGNKIVECSAKSFKEDWMCT